MESARVCIICNESLTHTVRCGRCRSAAYCSIECQQSDWHTHRALCRNFMTFVATQPRPSPQHHLAIVFPMRGVEDKPLSPRAAWVDSKELRPGYFSPVLDGLPAQHGHDNRRLLVVRDNPLRNRRRNPDTLNIWTVNNDASSALPAPTVKDMYRQGPLVAVLKVGAGEDPGLLTDMNMTAYRDAVDYLVRYDIKPPRGLTSLGLSMQDGVQIDAVKVRGVRINSPADQQRRGQAEMVQVLVPLTHPLFNLERNNVAEIPFMSGKFWVVKAYPPSSSPPRDGAASSKSRSAWLLCLRTAAKDGRWEAFSDGQPSTGSILVVDRNMRDLDVASVRAMCDAIEQNVVPLMTEERARSENGEDEVIAAIRELD